MTQYQSYAKPAITEALINFQVELLPDISLSNLENLAKTLKADYPLCQLCQQFNVLTLQGTIQDNSSDVEAEGNKNILGYRLINENQKQVLQAHLKNFTFSRLAPYQGWELFRNETRRLWKIYQSETHPVKINQVAVRYINRLDVPINEEGLVHLEDYLRTFPEISPDLHQGLQNYFIKLDIPQEDINGFLVIQQTVAGKSDNNKIGIILDIELSCKVDFSGDESSQWELLEKLRVRKNEIFEACITDQTRSLLNNA